MDVCEQGGIPVIFISRKRVLNRFLTMCRNQSGNSTGSTSNTQIEFVEKSQCLLLAVYHVIVEIVYIATF